MYKSVSGQDSEFVQYVNICICRDVQSSGNM